MKAQKRGNSTKKAGVFCSVSSALVMLVSTQGCSKHSAQDVSSTLSPGASKTCQADSGDYFSEVEPENSALEDAKDREAGSETLRRRLVRIDVQKLKRALGAGRKIRLPLFKDREVVISIEKVEITAGGKVATGRVTGEPLSAVTLAVNEDVVSGNINMSSGKFEIRYRGKGVHAIRVEGKDDEGSCLAVEAPPEPQAAMDAEPNTASEDLASPMATPVVDMLVAYTPAAMEKQGGKAAIESLIQMGIADTNRAMTDSGVAGQVRLVGILALKQNESSASNNWSADLSALQTNGDGKWDEVHAERKRVGADQVTVVGAYPVTNGVLGIGYLNGTLSSAFTIVRSSAFGQYTFSHELGHNLGLNHSDGLESSSGGFRTIIAYGSEPRIRRYSNPILPYNGYATGDGSHNEAKIINANIARVASILGTVVPDPVPAPSTNPAPGTTTDPGAGTTPGTSECPADMQD